jgi:glycosyltransferase involved in cell wall biosynthesis
LDFWGKLPLFKRFIKRLIDSQRLSRILAADVRIFETEDLAVRAVEQHNLARETVAFSRSAVSSLVTEESTHLPTRDKCLDMPAGFKVLLLSGYHPNKNIEFLVDAAKALKESGVLDARFILTLPIGHPGTQAVLQKARDAGVMDMIYNFGPVPHEGCCELYRYCDAAVLPSTLESFSNMIAESWAMSTPLLISDLSWCRSLCGEGAIYYKFLNACSLADCIKELKENAVIQEKVVAQGKIELAKYPTSKERFIEYKHIIEKAVASK